ncbi:ABC transporter permease subunit [Clostridium tyrobutyricum]|jgi:NitT/TauT family transport system permease protein|uniref:ABC transporter permease n=1 Tax=Clostridium tyrobutyricum TaxID=1519 RepID=UPI00189C5AA0|nr:ABC transporter permease [Clostridium tyrobutyricum]MBR9647329.1 ABC transporter permease [Clostridium tyrobutyricum]MBV4440598.1 ABC transporter permease subunit [Clostridium tyrobutyricum]MBV4447141.1 ABC transporter permease subunit [Clostridium tyrobutyricum]MBV4450033.1 ABC transporter permease subunit [Clostridium tyrobutyricum]
MSKSRKLISGFIGFGVLLVIWEVMVLSGGYEPSLLPSPIKVLNGMKELIANGVLIADIKISLFRFFLGYLSSVVAAIILGVIFGWFESLWSIFDPIAQLLRPISPIAWSPFIVLWFGIGNIPAIVIIFIASFFPVLLSTVSAVRKIDKTYLKVAKNFGIKQPYIFIKIIFPAAFPNIVTGLHIAVGTAWIFLVAGEMVGAQSGLGYLIVDSRNSLRSDLLLAGIIFIGILGLLLDKLLVIFEKWVEKTWGIVSGQGGK